MASNLLFSEAFKNGTFKVGFYFVLISVILNIFTVFIVFFIIVCFNIFIMLQVALGRAISSAEEDLKV